MTEIEVKALVPTERLEQLIGSGDPTSAEIHDMAVELINRRRAADRKSGPTAWFVKDFADGWIHFDNEAGAKREIEATGAICLVAFSPTSTDFDARIRSAIERKAEPVAFECSARKQSIPELADCDWPFCGCDPRADKVIAALQECGWTASQPIGYVGAVKIVPVEPTAAMIDAANESEASWKSIWPAMLSASPSPVDSRENANG